MYRRYSNSIVFLLASLGASAASMVQQPAMAQLSEVPHEIRHERRVYIRIEKEALTIPKDIGQLKFRYAPATNAADSVSAIVETVHYFAKERKLGVTIKGERVSSSALTTQQQQESFQLSEPGLQSLWARYQPKLIQRVFRPPFDKIGTNRRTGEKFEPYKRKLSYFVILPEGVDRKRFIAEAEKIPGVVWTHLPPDLSDAVPTPTPDDREGP